MKPDWNRRFAAGLLAILLCLCCFSMPAFASGSDPAPEPLPEILDEEPTTGGMEPEGVPITPKGNATLVDDFYGDKQLITCIVYTYPSPRDEGESRMQSTAWKKKIRIE